MRNSFGWDYPPGVTGNEPQINPPDEAGPMHIKFTVNITQVVNRDGDEVDVEEIHYKNFVEIFREWMGNCGHELEDDGRFIYFEMQDIEEICDICKTYPCRCG